MYIKAVNYQCGSSGLAASHVTGTIDPSFLTDLGLNPLNITSEDLNLINVTADEANIMCVALQHTTIYVELGDVIRPIYVAESNLFLYGSKTIASDPKLDPESRLIELKQSITYPIECNCVCCTEYHTYPEYLQRLILLCRELDTTEEEIKDQNGAQAIAGLVEFAIHKSMLKGLESQLKAVNLEVAFTMMTEKHAQQITRTYCARPDLIVKKGTIKHRTYWQLGR